MYDVDIDTHRNNMIVGKGKYTNLREAIEAAEKYQAENEVEYGIEFQLRKDKPVKLSKL